MIERITDIIGDEYLEWKNNPRKRVIISSHTGSGKTYFVFHTLLKDAIRENKKIVYLCNRKVLKQQLVNSNYKNKITVDNVSYNVYDYLYIVSYQYCETIQKFPDFCIDTAEFNKEESNLNVYRRNKIKICSDDVLYYVFDEAHYFLSDSSFNSNSNFWYKQKFESENSTYIFITATPESLYLFLHYKKDSMIENTISSVIDTNRNYKQWDCLINHYSDDTYYPNSEEIIERAIIERDENSADSIFKGLINDMNMVISDFQYNTKDYYVCSLKKDCSAYKCFYFLEYNHLINDIVYSDDKWIVFVDNEKEGLLFEDRLNVELQKRYDKTKEAKKKDGNNEEVKEKYAVFISSKTSRAKRSYAYKEFQNLTQNESFESKVIIATSVLDNGVNIADAQVKHIVISQPNKTEFLQMLGRLRLEESQKVNLYIKLINASKINALTDVSKKQILNAVKLKRFRLYVDGYYDNNKKVNAVIQARRDLSSAINQRKLPSIFKFKLKNSRIHNIDYNSTDILEGLEINKSVFINCLYNIYLYYDAMLEREEKGKSKSFYLERQLSWIDKTYDKNNWIEFINVKKELEILFKENSDKEYLEKDEYQVILRCIMKNLLTLPWEWLPEKFYNNKSRYDCKKSPTNTTINSVLETLGLPYRIKNKRVYKDYKRTVWYIDKEIN